MLRVYFWFEGFDDEVERLKFFKVLRSLLKVFIREEVKWFFFVILLIRKRDRFIVFFFYGVGLCVSELCNFKKDDVDFDRGLIVVRGGKGVKDRVVLILKYFVDEIRVYFESCFDESEYFFVEDRRRRKDKFLIRNVWYFFKCYG